MRDEGGWPLELMIETREGLAELRTTVRHVDAAVTDLRADVRRVDARLFQLLLGQLATLGAALGAVVAALAS